MSNNQRNPQEPFSRKPPFMALMIWMLVILTIAILFAFKFHPIERTEEWDQSTFERQLEAGNVIKVEITPETDRVLYVEGKYKKSSLPSSVPPLTAPLTPPAPVTPAAPKQPDLQYQTGYYTARVIYSENLDNMLRQAKGVGVDVKNKDTWWRSLIITVLPILLIVGLLYFLFSRQIRMAGKGAMQFGKSKARIILPDEHKVVFDDIAGADEAKEETKEIIDYLKDPLKFKMVGGKIPKGALLMGPPGTGKTLMAKAVAGEANVPFFSISGSDFVEMFVGVGASRVRDMFDQARKHCPCLIFIDEIDAVGRSRFSGIGGGHDEREQTLNALLVEMDGLETQEGVIILAATNRPDVLDPALLRPGRFDRQIVLDLPDIKGRRKILDVHIRKIKVVKDIDLDIIAKGTPGFSGADLANLVNEAALLAARNNRDAAAMDDLEEARDKVRWGRERKSRKISDKERKITAYHEAGHTLVALHCPDSMPVHKVTIIPRGQAYLGATMHLPEEDRYTQSKKELIDQITIYMGGRVAEEIIFNDITSGASSDIEQATRIARLMVCAFGMNDKMGTVQYGERAEHINLARDITKVEQYSEETAREIDIEIKKLLDGSKQRAENILNENKDKLELLSKELLEKETLDVHEIKKLLGMKDASLENKVSAETVKPGTDGNDSAKPSINISA